MVVPLLTAALADGTSPVLALTAVPVPRVLPAGVTAVFDRAAWKVPALFEFIREAGKVDREEMYRVFNMGLGLVIMVRAADAGLALHVLRQAGSRPVVVGRLEKGAERVRLIN